MAREKESYRDNLDRVNERAAALGFDRLVFTGCQIAQILGCSRSTLNRRYGHLTRGGTAVDIARAIS